VTPQNLDGTWTTDIATRGRVVLQYVFDSQQDLVDDRIRLYIDGVRVSSAPMFHVPLAQGQTLDIAADESLCIGNREIGDRSPRGAIGYGAIYSAALTDAELAGNAARLLASDD
jgi:hypothetical protein